VDGFLFAIKIFERKEPPDVAYMVGTAQCAVPTNRGEEKSWKT